MKSNRELVFLRTFAVSTSILMVFLGTSAFKSMMNQKFEEIDVERINIVEKDGTVKMIITNVERFPNGDIKINERLTNPDRKQRAGMLFFNEEGIEAGGFIFDGKKDENGHSSGLSLTYDQYDGDQVMQLLTQDVKVGDERFVGSTLAFNDRAKNETQMVTMEIMKELGELRKTNREAYTKKYQEYISQGLIGEVPRVVLGKTRSENNGLFLFDNQGMPRAMFYIDKNNEAKLDFLDEKGQTIATFPQANN